MGNVLVTDGLWRKSLSAVRALGKDGIDVTVSGDSIFTSSHFSKYCTKRIILPNVEENPEKFNEKLLNELKASKYGALFLMEDKTIKSVISERKEFEKLTSFPLSSNQSLEIAWDKSKTLNLAKELGIAIPEMYEVNNIRMLKELKSIKYPIVIKPSKSSGSRGLRYINDRNELVTVYKELKDGYEELVIQEKLPSEGQGVGVALLYDYNHKPVAGFSYKRLREYPVSGGPSTLRESTHDKDLLEIGITLLNKLKWVGVAMVEFKIDIRDGKPKLMEINPRFWGSLELPIVSGVNFPVLYYKLAVGEKIKPVFDYKVGVRCRWLIPGDMLHFISNPNRFKMKPSFFQFGNTYYDDVSLDDLGGTVGTILSVGANMFKPKMWKLALKR